MAHVGEGHANCVRGRRRGCIVQQSCYVAKLVFHLSMLHDVLAIVDLLFEDRLLYVRSFALGIIVLQDYYALALMVVAAIDCIMH